MKNYYIVASRGRNPENPSERLRGYTVQRLEINKRGISNTITSVQKDNYLLEVTYGKQEVQGNDQEVSREI